MQELEAAAATSGSAAAWTRESRLALPAAGHSRNAALGEPGNVVLVVATGCDVVVLTCGCDVLVV